MKDYISDNRVKVEFSDKKIFEEFSGEYTVKALKLLIKGQSIFFDPIGTMLIGAKGRIDLSGKNGKATFVLVNKSLSGPNIQVNVFTSDKERKDFEDKRKKEKPVKIEWKWKILFNKNQIKYLELNEESFFDIVMSLIDG